MTDEAGILDADTVSALASKVLALQRNTGAEVVVVTLSSLQGVSIEIGGNPAGVLAQTQATSGLTSPDIGDASANTGLNASFRFIAATSGDLQPP